MLCSPLEFPCTNNAAEYEALLHGLRMAKEMNLSRVKCFGDSDLVALQVSGTWDSKDPLIVAYRREVDIFAGHFKGYQVDHVDRRKNEAADALSRLVPNVNRCHPMFFWMFCITRRSSYVQRMIWLFLTRRLSWWRLFTLSQIGRSHIWRI